MAMSKLPCIINHPRERVKLVSGTVMVKEVAVLAVAAMQSRRKLGRHMLPIQPLAHLPLNMAVILSSSSSTTLILNQTKEGDGNTRPKPSGVHGLAAAIQVGGPLMVGGPIQEVGTTLVEGKTHPTLHRTTNPPTRREAVMPTGGLVPLRNQCLRTLKETEGKLTQERKQALGKRKMEAKTSP